MGPGLLGAESSGALDVLRPDPRDRILGTVAWEWVLRAGTSGRELATGSYSGWDPRDWARQVGPLGLDPTRLNSLRIESCPAEPS